MDVAAALQTAAAVFPAELPDKTMVATIVLVTRYQRPAAVWCGTAAAFTLHVVVAATAGSLLSLLPETLVTMATAALFATGAVLLWRSAGDDAAEAAASRPELTDVSEGPAGPGAVAGAHEAAGPEQRATAMQATSGGAARSAPLRAMLASFTVVGVAEWGDLSQLVVAGMAGTTGSPVEVGVGALVALLAVSSIGVAAGHGLVERVPLGRLQRGAAVIFAGLAALTLLSL